MSEHRASLEEYAIPGKGLAYGRIQKELRTSWRSSGRADCRYICSQSSTNCLGGATVQ